MYPYICMELQTGLCKYIITDPSHLNIFSSILMTELEILPKEDEIE